MVFKTGSYRNDLQILPETKYVRVVSFRLQLFFVHRGSRCDTQRIMAWL